MRIRVRQLDEPEMALVEQVVDTLIDHPRIGDIAVVSGALLKDGSTELSADVRSRKAWTCAEPGLMARILTNDLPPVRTVVAACLDRRGSPRVISPCGSCREMLRRWAPDGWVIVSESNDSWMAVSIEDLFPFYEMWPGA